MARLSALFGWLGLAFLAGFATSLGLVTYFSSTLLTGIVYPNWYYPVQYLTYIWFSFYVIKAIAGWLLWQQFGFNEAKVALYMLIVHLTLSAASTYLLFFIEPPINQCIQATIASLTLLLTVILFWDKSKKTALLLVPNLLWLFYVNSFYLVTVLKN